MNFRSPWLEPNLGPWTSLRSNTTMTERFNSREEAMQGSM